MPIKILMPALSPTMTQGNLVKWHKKEGDIIKSGQLLAEIETDKATMEVEAVDEGILAKIIISEGAQDVAVNSVIAILAQKGEDVVLASQMIVEKSNESVVFPLKEEPSIPNTQIHHATQTDSNRIIASPLAKRIAKNNGIDLTKIQGSGPRGRIVKADIENYKPIQAQLDYIDMPLSNMRKVIAKHLSESKQNTPHFYLSVECNMDKLLDLRTQINKSLEDIKISVNDFIIKAFSVALSQNPDANVMWMDNSLRMYSGIDLSIAVAIEGGLITPIIKNTHKKSLKEISLEVKELAQRAREGKLRPEEYQGGSMTISNLGMYGVEEFSAIINPPQSGILAIGKAVQKPIVINGEIKISSMLKATLSVDHRAIDGAVGAKLITDLKQNIENPLSLLL